jgi:hypothetical protein
VRRTAGMGDLNELSETTTIQAESWAVAGD